MTGPMTRRERIVLACIATLAAALRLFHLGYQSLWVDEMLTLAAATPKPRHPIGQLILYDIHGPLHAFVVYLFRTVGESDGWLRLPSALAGMASVPLLYLWVRPRFGARVAGWSALLLAVNPLHVHYSQELRNYAFAVMFVLAGCVQIDRALERWSRARAAAIAVCIAAAVLSNFSAVFALLAQSVVYIRRAGRSRGTLVRWAGVLALSVVLVSPWIYRVTTFVDFSRLATPVMPGDIEPGQRLRGDTTVRIEAIPYAAYAWAVGFTLGPSLRDLHQDASLRGIVSRHSVPVAWVAALYGALLGVAAVAGARRFGRGAVLELVGFVVIPLAATLALNWQNAKAFNVRYVLVGLPAFLALVALGIDGCGRVRARLVGALVAATSALSLGNYYFDPGYAKEDVRGAVHAVETRMEPGECLFAPTVWPIVEYYRRSDEAVYYVYRDIPGLMERQLNDLFVACPSFWYLRARPWVDDADGRVLGEIEARYREAESLDFAGVKAIRFVRKE